MSRTHQAREGIVKRFKDFPGIVAHPVAGKARHIIGAGLFASRSYSCGDIIISLNHGRSGFSKILAWEDVEEDDDNRVTAIAPGWYFHPNREHPFWYLNHSCHPNVAYCDWANYVGESTIPLVACRDINVGEEIVMDYSTMTTKEDGPKPGIPWSMKCYCGVNDCRRLLTSFACLPLPLQMKTLLARQPFSGMVPAFIVSELPNLIAKLQTDAPDLFRRLEDVLKKQLSVAQFLRKHSIS